MDNKGLEGVKVGDQICVSFASLDPIDGLAIRTIQSTTKTWVVDSKGEKWSRKDGYKVPRGDGYWRNRAEPATEEHHKKIADAKVRRNAQNALFKMTEHGNYKKMTLEMCLEVAALYRKYEGLFEEKK